MKDWTWLDRIDECLFESEANTIIMQAAVTLLDKYDFITPIKDLLSGNDAKSS